MKLLTKILVRMTLFSAIIEIRKKFNLRVDCIRFLSMLYCKPSIRSILANWRGIQHHSIYWSYLCDFVHHWDITSFAFTATRIFLEFVELLRCRNSHLPYNWWVFGQTRPPIKAQIKWIFNFLTLLDILYSSLVSHLIISVHLLRLIRVVRFNSLFLAYSPRLKLGLEALYESNTAACNLCQFLFLIIFTYALIGVAAFKSEDENIYPINDQISFHSVKQAIILLIQISTTAGWDGTYKVLIKDFNSFGVFLYLWSFLFICIFIIVTMVLTIILNYYTKAYDVETESTKLRPADLNDFNAKWNAIASMEHPLFINRVQLPVVINRLDKSSSLRSSIVPNEESIQLLGIPTHNEQQLYRGDVLIALNKNRLRQTSTTQAEK